MSIFCVCAWKEKKGVEDEEIAEETELGRTISDFRYKVTVSMWRQCTRLGFYYLFWHKSLSGHSNIQVMILPCLVTHELSSQQIKHD